MTRAASNPPHGRPALLLALWTLVLVVLGTRASMVVCVGGECCPLRLAAEPVAHELTLAQPALAEHDCCCNCSGAAGGSEKTPQPPRLHADCCPDCCLDLTLAMDPAPMPRAVAAPSPAAVAGPAQPLVVPTAAARETAPTPRQTGPPRNDRRTTILVCTVLRQ